MILSDIRFIRRFIMYHFSKRNKPILSKLKLKSCRYHLLYVDVNNFFCSKEISSWNWRRRSSNLLKKSQIAGRCRFSRKIIFGKSKGDKVKLSNWHPPAFPGMRNLIWKHCRRHWCTTVTLLSGTSLYKSIFYISLFYISHLYITVPFCIIFKMVFQVVLHGLNYVGGVTSNFWKQTTCWLWA